jgi:MauM/NapG family ferredoxin protein
VLGAIVLGALFGNLTLLVFDPLAIVFRTLGTAVWPAFDAVVTFAERGLYRIPVLRPAVGAFDAALRPGILPQQGLVARGGALFLGFFVGLIALNLLAERFWCRYLCPLGGLLGVLSKVGLIRRRVGSGCSACQLCARCCPTGTIRPEAGFASDPAECTLCLECLEACHRGDVRFPFQVGRAPRYAYDPNRRQALLTLGTAALGAGLLHADRRTRSGPSRPLRPPGASEGEMLSTCIRCGECVRACPTDALQPALVEAGLEGLWTPVMIPRLGYCSYACHACGQVCPVEAIPTLSLEVKRLAVIGRARIDRERCVAWAEALDCIVCEEMCPLPEKAVVLEHFEGRGRGAGRETVKRPHVIEARCIGCGICEYKCPVEGEAAIRVQAGHDQRPRSHPRRRGAVTSPSAPPDSQRSVLPRPHIIDTH